MGERPELTVLGAALLLGGIWAWLACFFASGREYRATFKDRYLRDPDEIGLAPALLGYVWRMGHLSAHELNATVLDLADRGVLAFGHSDEGDPTIVLLVDDLSALAPHELPVIKCIFGTTSFSGPDDESAADRPGPMTDVCITADDMVDFKRGITEWGVDNGVFEPAESTMIRTSLGLGWGIALWSFAAGLVSGSPWLLVGVPLGVLLMSISSVMRRRSKPAAEIHAKAEALRRYLEDFSRMAEKPAGAVVLWHRYLVYAEVFGMTREVRKAVIAGGFEPKYPFGSMSFWLDSLEVAWSPGDAG